MNAWIVKYVEERRTRARHEHLVRDSRCPGIRYTRCELVSSLSLGRNQVRPTRGLVAENDGLSIVQLQVGRVPTRKRRRSRGRRTHPCGWVDIGDKPPGTDTAKGRLSRHGAAVQTVSPVGEQQAAVAQERVTAAEEVLRPVLRIRGR